MDPKWSASRPKKVDQATRESIARIARCFPLDLGWPFSVWSLSKLREVVATNEIADISRETLRKILKGEGCRSRRSRPGKPAPTQSSMPKWAVSSTSTTIGPPTGG
ncbi:helix-turn-helix domain-containing protein [Nocardia sp. NPDC052112]|uniref:helix-turn-helix domain-containing protein n=1 Tax=Nocardia sp. NPDC052112 TaxID=3155646 RepID=UPI00342986A2